MISALLFLTFVEVHIHNSFGAANADHGHSVSISSLDTALLGDSADEIKVSPSGMLKAKHNIVNFGAVFLLVVTLLIVLTQVIIWQFRESSIRYFVILFHRSPPLRAPPL
ncbi:MAG: hypothetical protein COB26_07350 [Piscirickettsiaceae bacterium]|nr:MAG: hypothetical protein COB26_07350 [Piscirickettsiaceae bacterium]